MLTQEISDFLTALKVYNDRDLTWVKQSKMKEKFNLGSIGIGSTRIVFKKKWARTVIKVGCPYSNKLEYAISRATEGTDIEHLFASCTSISSNGLVLEQSFMRKLLDTVGLYTILDLEVFFQDQIKFQKLGTIDDIHPSNLAVVESGDIKIIDYAFGLERIKLGTPLPKMIKMIRKNLPALEHKPNFFLDNKKNICLQINGKMKISRKLTQKEFDGFANYY